MVAGMQELEARANPVEYNKNASGPTARLLGGSLMGRGDRYAIHALLQNDEVLILTSSNPEKLRIYNKEKE